MSAKLRMTSAMLLFGTIGLFVRGIPLASSTLAMVRGVLGAAFLLLVMGLQRRRLDLKAIRRNLPLLLLAGTANGINWILLFESYRYTSVAVATLCYYLAPVFVVFLSPLLLKERLTPLRALCALAALAGMGLLSGTPESLGEQGGLGILLALGAAALYASVVLMNKFLREISAYDITVVQLATAAVVLLPYVLLIGESAAGLTAGEILLVLTVGIVHTGVSYWLYFGAVGRLEGQTIALLSYLDPVVAVLLSVFLLREPMGPWGALGAALILGSTLLGELSAGRGKGKSRNGEREEDSPATHPKKYAEFHEK